jgi:hypothetical protein
MFEVELKEYMYNPNSEDLRGFCCGGSAAGFTAWRRQDGRFVWVLLSGTVDPRVRPFMVEGGISYQKRYRRPFINSNPPS